MHKVERNNPPKELEELNKNFQKRYNQEVNMSKQWSSIKPSLKKEIVQKLKEMYGGKCAYCEDNIGTTSFANIEHFKPKSKFPLLCYEYNNMNYACQVCNTNKLEKFNEKMINPSKDNPEKHIKFIAEKAVAKDERGEYMINILKLNDNARTESRAILYTTIKTMIESIETYCMLMNSLSEEDKEIAKKIVEEQLNIIFSFLKHGSLYYSMCKQNFGENVKMLNKKFYKF